LKVSWKEEFVALWMYLKTAKVRDIQSRYILEADLIPP
jgi:hypothetical protein